MNRVLSFLKLSAREKKLFAEAVVFLFYAKFLLSVMPFNDCIKKFEKQSHGTTAVDFEAVRAIGYAILRADKLSFWKNRCLVSSFAARFMLLRRNITSVLYLGLLLEKDVQFRMNAHAWLKVGDIFVTPKGNAGYQEIFRF